MLRSFFHSSWPKRSGPLWGWAGLLIAFFILLSGCGTTQSDPRAEFVRSVEFTGFDYYEIGPVEVMASELPAAQHGELLEMTATVLAEELDSRGFELADGDRSPQILVRARWRQSSRTAPMAAPVRLSSIDETTASAGGGPPVDERWYQLVIEIVDVQSGNVFWRSLSSRESFTRFLTVVEGESIVRHLIRNFPDRVITDPDLPMIL